MIANAQPQFRDSHVVATASSVVEGWFAGDAMVRTGLPARPVTSSFSRQLASYLAYVSAGITITRLAKATQRDRGTVLHAIQLIEDLRDVPEFDQSLDCLEALLLLRLLNQNHHGVSV